MDQHDKANKGNVTRTVTVVKGFARWGVRKFVGPKLKERALERTKKTEEITRRVPRKEIVKEEVPVYKNVPNHSKTSLQDITAKGEGTHYTGYENVAGGERLPQEYVLKSTDKITAAWEETPGGGTGISDLSGLKAPVLTDKTAATEFIDASGVLKQDLTVEQIGKAINDGVIDPNTYVSINDHHWVKLSDIYKPIMEKHQIGTTIKETIKTVYDVVKEKREVVDEKMVSLLEKLGGVANIAGKAIIGDEVYENVRRTNSDVKPEKPQPRQYDYEDNVLFEYQDKDAKRIDALKLKTKTMKKGKTPEQVAVEKTEEKQKKQEEIDNDMEGR